MHHLIKRSKDAGIRYIREILVYAEPGPHDALVVATADHLGQIYQASLNFVCVVDIDADAHELQARADYVDQLRDLCVSTTKATVVRDSKELSAIERMTTSFDLLIMGAPPDRSLVTRLVGSSKDILTRRAHCSVLWLKTPRTQTHVSFDLATMDKDIEAHLPELLALDCLAAKSTVRSKEELYKMASEMFSAHFEDIDTETIESALWEREQMQNTSLGTGLALPHATLARASMSLLGPAKTY